MKNMYIGILRTKACALLILKTAIKMLSILIAVFRLMCRGKYLKNINEKSNPIFMSGSMSIENILLLWIGMRISSDRFEEV